MPRRWEVVSRDSTGFVFGESQHRWRWSAVVVKWFHDWTSAGTNTFTTEVRRVQRGPILSRARAS